MTEILSRTDVAVASIRDFSDADNPSAYLALNAESSHFTLNGAPGLIVFRETGRYVVQFGGPFAPPETRSRLLEAFLAHVGAAGRTLVAVQLQAADAPLYLEHGFTVNQIGASYVVDLDSFSLAGTRFMQLRNKISRALRSGLVVRETPLDPVAADVADIDRSWLGSKGEHARQLDFLVGQTGGRYQPLRRLFVAEQAGRVVGYISYSPVYGSRSGWMHDLSRRRPDVPPGVMEAVNKHAIDVLRAEGVRWLHFGFTPFAGLSADLQFPGHSRAFHWFAEQLFQYGEEVYPAQSQLAYKQKWAPDVVLPEYVAFQHGASIPAFAHIFRACNAF